MTVGIPRRVANGATVDIKSGSSGKRGVGRNTSSLAFTTWAMRRDIPGTHWGMAPWTSRRLPAGATLGISPGAPWDVMTGTFLMASPGTTIRVATGASVGATIGILIKPSHDSGFLPHAKRSPIDIQFGDWQIWQRHSNPPGSIIASTGQSKSDGGISMRCFQCSKSSLEKWPGPRINATQNMISGRLSLPPLLHLPSQAEYLG